ncbi:MAG TPA: alpha/beta hydrolase [Solirubrobacteraceae bacterium]|nr:alpha/beta hydrolase [Solirubrobacteraceae bacterium]
MRHPRHLRDHPLRAPRGAATAILCALALTLLCSAPPATAALPVTFSTCGRISGFECATLAVALSRAGLASGTIALHIARLRSSGAPASSAVLALAGGPGQPALPFADVFAQEMAPALSGRDLITFDQRGTGESGPLSCASLGAQISTIAALQQALLDCANALGPSRGAFTTAESVADIEAIREALGYEKLVLFGTSYGTKVALEYAERYPQHVEALVLDSVVPTDGPEPFALESFRALKPVLDELCSGGACDRIAPDIIGELRALVAALRRAPLRGSVYNGAGVREHLSLDATGLFDLLLAGDLNPALRALFPAALSAALRSHPAPLLQLEAIAEGLIPSLPRHHVEVSEEPIDEALYWATTCEEERFPWQRSASPARRTAEAEQALRAIPESDFAPFFRQVALQAGPTLGCVDWPNVDPPPAATGTLPNVPTLILSGAQDLRTPSSQARRVKAQIPDAQLLVVPYTGHSVLGSDLSGCAQGAVALFFAGAPVGSCPASRNPFAPTPIPPQSVNRLRGQPGVAGRAGQTVTAALDTFLALDRIVIAATLQAERSLPSGVSFGGLYGGYARLSATGVRLVRLSFIPGVTLSGDLPVRAGKLLERPLQVGGAAAAHGSILISASGSVSGDLGGHRFDVHIATAELSRSGGLRTPLALHDARAWSQAALLTLPQYAQLLPAGLRRAAR